MHQGRGRFYLVMLLSLALTSWAYGKEATINTEVSPAIISVGDISAQWQGVLEIPMWANANASLVENTILMVEGETNSFRFKIDWRGNNTAGVDEKAVVIIKLEKESYPYSNKWSLVYEKAEEITSKAKAVDLREFLTPTMVQKEAEVRYKIVVRADLPIGPSSGEKVTFINVRFSSGSTYSYLPYLLLTILHDPNGDKSYTGIVSQTQIERTLGLKIGEEILVADVQPELSLKGTNGNLDFKPLSRNSIQIIYTPTIDLKSELNSSDSSLIGPGLGDIYVIAKNLPLKLTFSKAEKGTKLYFNVVSPQEAGLPPGKEFDIVTIPSAVLRSYEDNRPIFGTWRKFEIDPEFRTELIDKNIGWDNRITADEQEKVLDLGLTYLNAKEKITKFRYKQQPLVPVTLKVLTEINPAFSRGANIVTQRGKTPCEILLNYEMPAKVVLDKNVLVEIDDKDCRTTPGEFFTYHVYIDRRFGSLLFITEDDKTKPANSDSLHCRSLSSNPNEYWTGEFKEELVVAEVVAPKEVIPKKEVPPPPPPKAIEPAPVVVKQIPVAEVKPVVPIPIPPIPVPQIPVPKVPVPQEIKVAKVEEKKVTPPPPPPPVVEAPKVVEKVPPVVTPPPAVVEEVKPRVAEEKPSKKKKTKVPEVTAEVPPAPVELPVTEVKPVVPVEIPPVVEAPKVVEKVPPVVTPPPAIVEEGKPRVAEEKPAKWYYLWKKKKPKVPEVTAEVPPAPVVEEIKPVVPVEVPPVKEIAPVVPVKVPPVQEVPVPQEIKVAKVEEKKVTPPPPPPPVVEAPKVVEKVPPVVTPPPAIVEEEKPKVVKEKPAKKKKPKVSEVTAEVPPAPVELPVTEVKPVVPVEIPPVVETPKVVEEVPPVVTPPPAIVEEGKPKVAEEKPAKWYHLWKKKKPKVPEVTAEVPPAPVVEEIKPVVPVKVPPVKEIAPVVPVEVPPVQEAPVPQEIKVTKVEEKKVTPPPPPPPPVVEAPKVVEKVPPVVTPPPAVVEEVKPRVAEEKPSKKKKTKMPEVTAEVPPAPVELPVTEVKPVVPVEIPPVVETPKVVEEVPPVVTPPPAIVEEGKPKVAEEKPAKWYHLWKKKKPKVPEVTAEVPPAPVVEEIKPVVPVEVPPVKEIAPVVPVEVPPVQEAPVPQEIKVAKVEEKVVPLPEVIPPVVEAPKVVEEVSAEQVQPVTEEISKPTVEVLPELAEKPEIPVKRARLLANPDFSSGLKSWDKIETPGGKKVVQIIPDAEGYANVLEFKRLGTIKEKGELGISQSLNLNISESPVLMLGADVKAIFSSMESDKDMAYPVMLELEYQDAQGNVNVWKHGFLYDEPFKETIVNYPEIGEKIAKNKWYSYSSPNLMETLIPKPTLLTKLKIYGAGMGFKGMVDNVKLVTEGVIPAKPPVVVAKVVPEIEVITPPPAAEMPVELPPDLSDLSDLSDRGTSSPKEEAMPEIIVSPQVILPQLTNGDFIDGLEYWQEFKKGSGKKKIQVVSEDATYPNVLEFKQTKTGKEKGEIGVEQRLNMDISEYVYVVVKADVKVISSSLKNDGMEGGDYPVTIELEYEDAQGNITSFKHGFLYQKQINYPKIGERIAKDSWYSWTSPNLIDLITPKPRVIKGVKIYGSGMEIKARAGNLRLICERTLPLALPVEVKAEVQKVIQPKVEIPRVVPEEVIPTPKVEIPVKLLTNGDFVAGLRNWEKLETGKGVNKVGVSMDSDEYPTVLEVTRVATAEGKLGVSQSLSMPVADYISLILTADVKILYSSVFGDKFVEGAYPLTLELEYTDIEGNTHLWQKRFKCQGKITAPDMEEVIKEKVWHPFASGNLIRQLSPRPNVITRINIYGCGWGFWVKVSNIQLMGE